MRFKTRFFLLLNITQASFMEPKVILNNQQIQLKFSRLTQEVSEIYTAETPLYLVGIKNTGLMMAQVIHEKLQAEYKISSKLLGITINKSKPNTIELSEMHDFTDAQIVMIDDVVNSGRTLMYALKPFLEFLPKSIHTMVLVERMYKQFPIQTNFVGLSVATTMQDLIEVQVVDNKITQAVLK